MLQVFKITSIMIYSSGKPILSGIQGFLNVPGCTILISKVIFFKLWKLVQSVL